jgi:M3 family oligoendopeptidase
MIPFEHFSEIRADEPNYEQSAERFAALERALDEAQSLDEKLATLREWDDLQRQQGTWGALVYLHFYQDTTREDYVKAREEWDRLQPRMKDLHVRIKKRLLGAEDRPALEGALGKHVFELWRSDAATFEPAIEADLVKESELDAEYVALMASARIEFEGKQQRLPDMRRYLMHADRDLRHRAERATWGWFKENSAELDRIYDGLVKLRHKMAQTLGYENFINLGYLRMSRVDYTQQDVERFRAQVRDQLVPLVAKLREQQAKEIGVESLRWWDESLHDHQGNPTPVGGLEGIVNHAFAAFDQLNPDLAAFYRTMHARDMLDLGPRAGKAGGGFCTSFPTHGSPYIFANFNGTQDDVRVFIHELGHAFQCWRSRGLPLADQLFPTFEACEIHSMGLEFLAYPAMEHFFGDAAERYRKIHLTDALMFIPYGVAVDHFQHLVYAKPDATPQERCEMWQEMERTYLPWRNYEDLERPAQGGFWQKQPHIYSSPFYYIDYTLAQTCALQYWAWSRQDPKAAWESYVELCGKGGSAAFQTLARGAGLTSPFDDGCLARVIEQARLALGV